MKNIIIIGLVALSIQSFTLKDKVAVIIKKEIHKAFSISDYSKEPVIIDENLNQQVPRRLSPENFFKLSSGNEHIGFYYLGSAFGKADTFDFLILLDTGLSIKKIKILKYREDHGGEIGSVRWLKQFIGATNERTLVFQKDIAGISGATISAKALTHEVNEFLKTLRIVYKSN